MGDPVRIDWEALAVAVNSLDASGERGGDEYASRALERILGTENLAGAVEHILAFAPGSELVMNVLRLITSRQAAEMAYQTYQQEGGERAARAVWLIKHIGHPCGLAWVEEFLNDENVAGWGIDVLDQLLWTHRIDPEEAVVSSLLVQATQHQNANIREQAASIKDYLDGRGYSLSV